MKSQLLFFLLLFSFTSCSNDDTQNEMLYGKWQAISWTVNGEESGRNASSVSFEFQAENQYSATFGQQKEEGTFKLKNDQLFTTATGKSQKMVKLPQIGTDTIVMDMNRQGDAEQIILVRQ